jgi:zinc transporter ZupT
LLSIAFVHFLPELYESDTPYSIGIFILIGFLIQLFLEYFSGGIEHGHIHVHKNNRIPWALFISLSIHSFIEGIPLAGGEVNAHHDHLSAQSLLLGILFHQTPVAIALMTLLKGSGITNTKSWVILISFSLMTPMGLVFGKFAHNAIDTLSMNLLLAIVVGMFLHISTTIIFEASENHRFNLIKLISIIIGVILAVMIA